MKLRSIDVIIFCVAYFCRNIGPGNADVVTVEVDGSTPPTSDSAKVLAKATGDKTFIATGAKAEPASPGSWTLSPDDGNAAAVFSYTGSNLVPSTEYTITFTGLADDAAQLDDATNPNSEAIGRVCTKPAPLALTLDSTSSTDKTIKVTWTKAAGGNNPDQYTLKIGDEVIGTVGQDDTPEFTYTTSTAAGAALAIDTAYTCKITASIPAFGTDNGCAAETLDDDISCEIKGRVALSVEGSPTYESATLAVTAPDTTTDFKAGSVEADPNDGTWTLTPNDGAAHTKFSVKGIQLKASTEYTVTVKGLESGTYTIDTTVNTNNEAEGKVCTAAAPLELSVGSVSEAEKTIQVTWTKAAGTNVPPDYTLMIGSAIIGTVGQADAAEFTYNKEDATGTALKLNTEYKCKISATIAQFGSCDEQPLVEEIPCKIASTSSKLIEGVLPMLLCMLFGASLV